MKLGALFAKLRDSFIADMPDHLDDEKNYGLLASDIARTTSLHPAIIKQELDKMEAAGNPLVNPRTLNEGRRDGSYSELVKIVRQRIEIAYPDKKGPPLH